MRRIRRALAQRHELDVARLLLRRQTLADGVLDGLADTERELAGFVVRERASLGADGAVLSLGLGGHGRNWRLASADPPHCGVAGLCLWSAAGQVISPARTALTPPQFVDNLQ